MLFANDTVARVLSASVTSAVTLEVPRDCVETSPLDVRFSTCWESNSYFKCFGGQPDGTDHSSVSGERGFRSLVGTIKGGFKS